MKVFNNKLLVVLWGVLIPALTANCSDKKTVEKAETAETTANTESVIKVSSPPFKKFVVVTVSDEGLFKKADTNSPHLVRWIESDCESDYCENIYQWSDQPGKQGFEISTDIIDCEGRVFPVLGEEGKFYKVSTFTKWCDIESAYILKANVEDIECLPIKADMLEADDIYFKCRVMKDGKYNDIVFVDEYDELEGETLQVGVLNDGIVAIPLVYNIFCQIDSKLVENLEIKEKEGFFYLYYSKSLALTAEDGEEPHQLDLKKLSTEQIARIVDTVTKKKPEYAEYMYHFPAQGLESFVYKVE
jgi:hypothetical protein